MHKKSLSFLSGNLILHVFILLVTLQINPYYSQKSDPSCLSKGLFIKMAELSCPTGWIQTSDLKTEVRLAE